MYKENKLIYRKQHLRQDLYNLAFVVPVDSGLCPIKLQDTVAQSQYLPLVGKKLPACLPAC